MKKDYFQDRAKDWDKRQMRVDNAIKIAGAIKNKFVLSKDMKILDFGVGTGLLGFEILKCVDSVWGVDTSKEMIETLKSKNKNDFKIEPIHQDILKTPLDMKFNGIVSSMTMHHIKDLELFFQTLYGLLEKNGFIAIADLQSEDGSFHASNEGVFHFGFNEKELFEIVKNTGFCDIDFINVNTISKPHGDFGIFLLCAKKK